MNCQDREQELLLLAHGELPLLRRMRAQLHLRVCSACRARYAQWITASRLLAAAIRDPQMPGWTPALNHAGTGGFLNGGFLPALSVLVLIAFCLIGGAAVSHMLHSGKHAHPKSSAGCLPNLPSDRCR